MHSRLAIRVLCIAGVLVLPLGKDQSPPADARVAKLVSFFRSYDCPEPYHVTSYLRAADNHDLDYRLLPVISVLESSCGKHQRHNNHWGWGEDSFPSVGAGIDFIAKQLTEGYFKDASAREKLSIYNPSPLYAKLGVKLLREFDE
jgi:hypothetical protein